MSAETMATNTRPTAWWYGSAARALSFVMAVALSGLILVFPNAVATTAADINHGVLSLWMWGIAAGFVHGVGYVPVHAIWRLTLGPLAGWVLMPVGLIVVLGRL